MTTATVAAILTVLGYSIYDTIIVFDRVRENMPLMPRATFATIANVSLWETMRRSLATTFITLLPIASLLLFGGETLKDFAFALFVGIGLGAVSTIFVATPFLTVLMERSPEFRGRIGADVVEKGVGGAVAVEAAAQSGGRGRAGPSCRARRAHRRWLPPPGDGAAPRRSRSASSAGSGDARGHMAEPDRSPRELAERLGLAAVGAVALTAERIDELAGELAERGGMQPRRGSPADRGGGRPLARRRHAAHDARRPGPSGHLRPARAGRRATSSRSSSSASPRWSTVCASSKAPRSRARRPCKTEGVASGTKTRNLGRMSEIAQVAVRHGFGYFFSRNKLTDLLPGQEISPDGDASSERGRRLRETLDELGPTFVKFGQLLSTRPDVVPPDIVVELRKLQDDVSPFPFAQVEQVINEELGQPIERLFVEFVEQPIAAASIGQVHEAVLPNGRRVAVKVQRPTAPRQIEADLLSFTRLRRSRRTASGRSTSSMPQSLVDEFARSMREELDYRQEARNAKTFHRNFAGHPHVRIPRVFWSYTSAARAHARVPRRDADRRPPPR